MISELRPIQPSGEQMDFDKRFLEAFARSDFMKKLYVKYPTAYMKNHGNSEK